MALQNDNTNKINVSLEDMLKPNNFTFSGQHWSTPSFLARMY